MLQILFLEIFCYEVFVQQKKEKKFCIILLLDLLDVPHTHKCFARALAFSCYYLQLHFFFNINTCACLLCTHTQLSLRVCVCVCV